MRTILFLIQKEFKQIIRNRALIPIIFFMPLFQIIVLGNAATYDIKNIYFTVLDNDNSSISNEIVYKLSHNKYFTYNSNVLTKEEAISDLEKDNADFIFVIDKDFEKDIKKGFQGKIQIIIDAVDGAASGIIISYINEILKDVQFSINEEQLEMKRDGVGINSIERNWYNEYLNYKWFMVPGILVFLVTMIGVFVNSMNIAREKEIGTIDQLNVTPITKTHFIAGKLIPMMIIALLELTFGLIISKYIFGVPIVGSLGVIYLFAVVYLVIMLSIGLIISSRSDTQQQAMFVAYFLIMIFLFLSGLFTPIASMPNWAQLLTKLIPISYFIEVLRNTMLKGSTFFDQIHSFLILLIYAFLTFFYAIWNYKKMSD